MRPGTAVAMVARPALSGTMRARQTKKRQDGVTKGQWLGYIGVAVFTTWLTNKLDDYVDRRFGDQSLR